MEDDLAYVYRVQKEVNTLRGVYNLLDWDQSTLMPKNAVMGRSEQTKIIDGIIHEKLTSDKLRDAIRRLKGSELNWIDAMIVKELDKEIERNLKIPLKFLKELSKFSIISQRKWADCRKSNDLNSFLPTLKRMVSYQQQLANYYEPSGEPYAALLNEYEEGMTPGKLDDAFSFIGPKLTKLLNLTKESEVYKNQEKIAFRVTTKEQRLAIIDMMGRMGLEKEKYVLGASAHPFTTRLSLNDVRITTRFKDPLESFFSAVHEAGHAVYEMQLPNKYYNTVIYNAASFGLDESQAIYWENMVARSKSFWKGYSPEYNKVTGLSMSWTQTYAAANQVNPSLIRVSADELTYNFHIMIRYELERELINGNMRIKELKDAWNSKMNKYLGVVPKTDSQGVLQDIHWSCGDFGYFPTYTIGMIYASQIDERMRKDIHDYDGLISKREFAPMLEWLQRKIHSKGKSMSAEQIIKKSCNRGLEPQSLVNYLNAKYSELYDLK